MNSKKNKYLTKLITSYSLVLVIVLILGVIFHFILAHNVKQELLNENMLSLKNVNRTIQQLLCQYLSDFQAYGK